MKRKIIIIGVAFFAALLILLTIQPVEREVRDKLLISASDWEFVVANATKVVFQIRGGSVPYYERLCSSIDAYYRGDKSKSSYMESEENRVLQLGQKHIFNIWIEGTEKEMNLACFLVEEKEGMYSYPLYIWKQSVEGSMSRKGIYYDKDRVARDIAISCYNREITEMANEGIPLIYGAGTGSEITKLTILGKKPDEVIKVMHGGKEFYFWYYLNGTEITDKFDKIENMEKMTMAEAIDYFEIRMEE